MRELIYDRQAAVEYAKIWAFRRNPAYLNFDGIGGDCTNYVSQCLFAGSGIMNSEKDTGWYYYSSTNRAAAWTGVAYLYRFLIGNTGVGPYAVHIDEKAAAPGDIVQLGNESGHFYHSLIVVEAGNGIIYVAAHSDDAYRRPLYSYTYSKARFLHIAGVRGPWTKACNKTYL